MLYVARKPNRNALMIARAGTEIDPTLLFPMTKSLESQELDELVRAVLQRQGVSGEGNRSRVIEEAEAEYEKRIKIAEARRELHRLMDLKKDGKKLMSVGHKKWKEVYYPARKIFKEGK